MIARIPLEFLHGRLLYLLYYCWNNSFMIFLAGKIYRVGILMYGNKATLKEIGNGLRASSENTYKKTI
jgi:ABC-2 type transport system permease protein